MKIDTTNLENNNFSSAGAIQDPATLEVLNQSIDLSVLSNDNIIDDFLISYKQWIQSGENNNFIGLEDFNIQAYSNGTTESFDKFYLKNHNRRFRCPNGDYMYHKLAWRNHYNWAYLEDDDLKANDALVISLPFADTGDQHEHYHQWMSQCEELNIPVLLDCAYFGLCKDIDFDFSYSCITDIAFSLSKIFPVAYARIGMRLTKIDDDDTLLVYHKINYNNKIGAGLGLKFLNKFSPDYIYNKYSQQQQDLCKTLSVEPSKTVLFGIGSSEWQKLNRGTSTNRLSFHRYFS
jgi:hypothetical protein